jgi:heme/copper-type cytochrome/quinol oxidase subunit 2
MFFLSFSVWGANIYYREQITPDDAMEIHVVGKQWMWKIQRAEGNREINELHVPMGRDVKLVMATDDVIHSFFLPAFRVKQDVVPGRCATLWFDANRTGNFPIFCAEYCGTGHSFMVGRVIVMTPQDYEAGLERGKPVPLQNGEFITADVSAGDPLFHPPALRSALELGDHRRRIFLVAHPGGLDPERLYHTRFCVVAGL